MHSYTHTYTPIIYIHIYNRQVKIWDPRQPSVEVYKKDIDSQSGNLIPMYDQYTKLLYITGNITYENTYINNMYSLIYT